MSFIPEKAMHHAHAAPNEAPDDSGKIVPIDSSVDIASATGDTGGGYSTLSWVLGAAGAGVAVAAAAAALLSLRSSSTPARRRTRKTAKPRATKTVTPTTAKKQVRRRTAKKTPATA